MNIKKGDFVCMTKSLRLSYKLYYIVSSSVEDGIVNAVRCSTTIPNTFVYDMPLKEVTKIDRCSIELSKFIMQQLEKNRRRIAEERTVEIYLRRTQESIRIINEDIRAITFFNRENKRYTFELLENPQPVLTPYPYEVAGIPKGLFPSDYEWIKTTLGRCFNIEESCVKKENLFLEEL